MQAPSTDLVIKLAAVGVAGLVILYLVKKGASVAGDVVNAVNPMNNENIVNSAYSGFASDFVPDGQPGTNAAGGWTWGAWFYDVTHPAEFKQWSHINDPISLMTNTGGATGTW